MAARVNGGSLAWEASDVWDQRQMFRTLGLEEAKKLGVKE